MSNPIAPARLTKGSLVSIDSTGAQTEIPFQYNPASIRRSLQQRTVGGEAGGHSEVVRFTGAPTETFTMQIEIEGLAPSDEAPNQQLSSQGVFPNLYALEVLMYPDLPAIQSASQALASGALEITPAVVPLILLVLGPQRVAPVIIASYEVVEQLFNSNLTPLRATVDLSLRVLSYSDVVTSSPAYSRFVTYQKSKQSMAGGGTR
ncbi:hypothetical protein WMF04_23925 [Sorangium sp. So ce260]|uniref:hypothetical protein n=1 Tax=Sorangium sp. So ce260 TaxID=3133291 RepID=UPI003F6473B3